MLGWFRAADHARFLLETSPAIRIAGDVRGQRFQGDKTIQPDIPGAPYLAHAAFAQLVENFVGPDLSQGTHAFTLA